MKMLKLPSFSSISKLFKELAFDVKKHSPEILTALGIVGSVSSVVLTAKAVPKAQVLIGEEEEKTGEGFDMTDPNDVVKAIKVVWKPFIPALVTEGLSIACIIGSNRISSNRGAALAAAYALSEEAFKDYKDQVTETVGEKKEKEISDSVAKKTIEEMPVKEEDVVLTGHGNTLFYDPFVARYFRSDIQFVRKCINDLDDRIFGGMEFFVSLDDFYYEMNLPRGSISKDIGWNVDYPLREDFSYQGASNGEPCVVMDFENRPQYAFKDLYGC